MKKNSIGQRLKRFRENRHLSQLKLAELVGWGSQSRIGNYESGSRKISVDDAILLADALGVTPSELLFGEHANVIPVIDNRMEKYFPIISWVSAGSWNEAVEPYSLKDLEKSMSTSNVSENSFWLKVVGNSMTSPVGLSVPEGMLILVDPNKEPANGKLVVAKLENENEATFKKLVIDSGKKYLTPLNPNWPVQHIEINGNCRIVGVVVEAKWDNL